LLRHGTALDVLRTRDEGELLRAGGGTGGLRMRQQRFWNGSNDVAKRPPLT
jgi:hypothetical protein